MQQARIRTPLLWAAGATAALGALAATNAVRAERAKRDNPPIGTFAEVDGVRLHYLEAGAGDPILLVHGNGTMLQDWIISGLFDELAKTNRVIAVDRPGFGHSSRPRGISWTPERQAKLLVDFLDKLDIDRIVAVGHSIGAQVVTALALDHPERLKGVALIGGPFYPEPRADVLMIAGSAIPGYGDILNRTLMPLAAEAMRKRFTRKLFGPAEETEAWRRDFSFAFALRPSRVRAGASDAVHMIPAARRLAPRYGEIELPVAIIAGRGDRIVDTDKQSARLHHELPHSRLILLDGVGHMAHHNAMRDVAAAVRLL